MSETVRSTPPQRLEAAFRAIHAQRMRDLPFLNARLRVEAVGFRRWEGRWLGVLITPWFMNLVLLPDAPQRWQSVPVRGAARYEFPAGAFDFIGGCEAQCGEFQSCSLFSPVFEFDAQEVARATAEAVLAALFDPAVREGSRPAEHNPTPAQGVSRRDVLRGRWGEATT
jgi:[NiFe] hydrogenase assembly HybE family chaperone